MSDLLIKSQSEILDDILRTLQAGMYDVGKEVDISQGSDYYILAQAITNEINLANQNIVASVDAMMPDTAQEEDLDRLLVNYGVEARRPAQPAKGYITIKCTQQATVSTNARLTASNGVEVKVLEGGLYNNNDQVEVESITGGESTNLIVGDKLTWTSPPAYVNPISLVYSNFAGGADAEDYESARQRLFAKLQSPANDYNWSHIAKICEEADTIIQKAYVYPACNGPSTVHIALTRNAVESNKYRSISQSQLTRAVQSITELMPEYIETYITTVNDTAHNVSLKVQLPYPLGSSNTNLFGGGWINPNPYPMATAADGYAYVGSLTNSTKFQIVSNYNGTLPTAGLTQISWLNKNTWKLETAYITSFTIITSGPTTYVVEVNINKPFVGLAAGDFIMPAMVNGQSYINAMLSEYNKLGPGEKTDVAGVLPRAYRKPRPFVSNPSGLDGQALKNFISQFPEVKTADYLFQSETEPALPAIITYAPNIFVPNKIAFYPYF